MSSSILSTEKNIVTLEIIIEKEAFQKAVKQSYNKNKSHFSIQGFRKGKVPQKIVEAHYGREVFYEDAIDFAFPDAYRKALEETKVEPATRPEMESVKSIGEDGATFIVKVGIKPEVVLNDYKGAEIESLEPVVLEADILAEIAKVQDQNARIITDENAEAKLGDTVTIDYEGFTEGVAFEGGKGESHPLVLGSGNFIPGFEEQLVGHKKGDDVEVKVTFPEVYHSNDLAGKEAIFKVQVKEIQVKELPELDDEFVKDVSEFDTLEEYKKNISDKLFDDKKQQLRQKAESDVVDFAIANSEIEIPYIMVNEDVDRAYQNYERQMGSQGLTLEDYLKYTGSTVEAFKENMKADAEKSIKMEFVLTKIAEVENLEVTEEELDAEYKIYADAYKQELDEYKKTLNEQMIEYVRENIKRRKAVELLIDEAKIK